MPLVIEVCVAMLPPEMNSINVPPVSRTGEQRCVGECPWRNSGWRKHMGVEPTSDSPRPPDDGFEDRRKHRLPRASVDLPGWQLCFAAGVYPLFRPNTFKRNDPFAFFNRVNMIGGYILNRFDKT